ncbi:MAG TPA: hypothetical protein PKC19_01380 [Roseiflexaceae bacterium]|nr:hypothetical protein [Roseiflexaceae bacterium]
MGIGNRQERRGISIELIGQPVTGAHMDRADDNAIIGIDKGGNGILGDTRGEKLAPFVDPNVHSCSCSTRRCAMQRNGKGYEGEKNSRAMPTPGYSISVP